MGKLICPHCGAFTAPTPVAFEATMSYRSDSGQVYQRKGVAEAITHDVPGQPVYGIMTCQSCSKWFVAEKVRREWSAVYPIQHKPAAEEIPEPIKSEFEEANLCFAIGVYKACVTMCMVALESLWQQQNASGLNDLKGKGVISSRLFDQATEIRLWAGLVKHELVHETVTREETEELLTYLGEILHDVYVRPARSAALARKREQVKSKPKASPSASE